MYSLEFKNVKLKKKKQVLLDSCSMCFQSGKYYAVLGDSMAELQFFREYAEGTAEVVEGEILPRNCSEKDIYFISSEDHLFDCLSLIDNLLIGQTFSITEKKARLKELRELMDEVDCRINLRRRVQTLSLGNKKIIELMRGYFLRRKIFVLENVYSLLDYEEREVFDRLLTCILKEGNIVILCTGSIENAIRKSDEILVFFEKQIREVMRTQNVRKNPREVLRRAKGWESSKKSEDSIFDNSEKFMELLVNTSEVSTMTQEVEQIFEEFEKFGYQYTGANKIILYLYDYQNYNLINNLKDEENHFYRLKEETLEKLLSKEQFVYENDKNKSFYDIFENEIPYRSAIFQTIEVEKYVKILLCFLYKDYYVYTKNDYVIIRALSRELDIAVEKSRLVGKSTLLQESHHRIKNNLQLVVSTLSLQKMFNHAKAEKDVDEILDKAISQIKTIAAIHNLMSRNDAESSSVRIRELVETIAEFYQSESVTISLDLDDMLFPYHKATNFAILINELMNNCTKYGRDENNNCRMEVSCKNNAGSIKVVVRDHGPGFQEKDKKEKKSGGMGINLLTNIVKQDFKTELIMENENGAKTTIEISKANIFAN